MKKRKPKERIYVCHTYYHVYVACLKELTLPRAMRGKADLVLSTMSNDFGSLKERAEKSGLFEAVFMFEEKEEQKCPTLDMESCLIDFEKTNFELDDTDTIPLQHSLFYRDALVFENLNSTCVSLKSRQSGRGVMMEFSGFPMLGIWSAANDGPYVALEPWTGCATAVQEDDVFEKKHGMRTLQPGEEAEYAYTVFEI